MLIHYLKITFRVIWKYKTQSFTGIFGLAFGLAYFVPSLYWIRYETSYDNFYPDAANIYRIYSVEKQSGKVNELVPGILGRKIHEQLPAVKASTSFYSEINNCRTVDISHIQLRTLNVDSTFFGVFKQEFVCGNALQPLQTMFDIVLTETMAIRIFGDVEKAIGQQLQSTFYFFNPPYMVTSVVKDPPLNSNLPFDALLYHDLLAGVADSPEEFQWLDFSTQTYVKLHPNTDVEELSEKLHDFAVKSNPKAKFEVQMMHVSGVRHRLNSGTSFTMNFMRLFFAAGMLLILSALFNFLNFHLDMFRQRSQELRHRSVHGAKSRQLILQMMFELFCSYIIVLALACIFLIITRLWFFELLGISIELLPLIYIFIFCGAGVMLLILLIGLIASWRISRLVVPHLSKRKTAGGQPVLRRMAVTLQLAVSVVFIIAASVVMMQLRFVNSKDLGFDHKGTIQLHGLPPYIQGRIRTALIHELEAIPQIRKITTSNFMPQHNANTLEMITVIEWPSKIPYEKPAFNVIPTDSRFAETLGLKMQMGEWWGENGGVHKIVLNEEAVRIMGLSEPVGTIIRMAITNNEIDEDIEEYEIVGVVKDFHTQSLRNFIQPTIFRPSLSVNSGQVVADNILYVHVETSQEQEAKQRITTILPNVDPMMEDVNLTSLGELYSNFNQSEQAGLQLFSILAILCMLISLFGIYAVATASTQRRRKEIAIRKIVGAKVKDIIHMFFREYTLQVIIAGVVALPLAYIAMSRWLQGYAYRTNIPWWLLAGVILGVAAIVLLTVLGQVLKVTNSNPGEVVKNE